MKDIELSAEEVAKYPEFPDHMTPIGKFTYLRTYSRPLPREKRREFFRETVLRASTYSVGLEMKHRLKLGLPIPRERMRKELRMLFDNMFGLKQALSGRTMWVGGAENGVADKYPLANFNCSFTITETWEDLAEAFYLLLVGTGVGFKSIPEMAAKLAPIRSNVKVVHDSYEPVPKWDREDKTDLITQAVLTTAYIRVGDSKEGWVDALRKFLQILTEAQYASIKTIVFNYDWVRPNGEALKTFGGTASGHIPLMEMFEGFMKVLNNQIDPFLAPLEDVGNGYVKVRPIHVVDMCNLIGYNVVVGGVRRTAEIALGAADDWEFIFAKYGINGIWGEEGFAHHEYLRGRMEALGIPVPAFWDTLAVKWYVVKDDKGSVRLKTPDVDVAIAYAARQGIEYYPYPCNEERALHHRRMSNNSIGFLHQPEQSFLDFLFEVMQKEGEPGFVNLRELAIRRLNRLGVEPTEEAILALAYYLGVNPCGEIDLYSKGVCNLTTINVKAFVQNGRLDYEGLIDAQILSTRAGLRMTLVTLELPNWDARQKQDVLLGVSLTGWKDAMGEIGASEETEADLLHDLRETANVTAEAYARELRVPTPLLVTTVKPEGTLTLVLGAGSSGLHFAKVRKGVRRIRINSVDPLAKAVQEHAGWTVSPEVGTEGSTDAERLANARTLVVDFPIKSEAKQTEQDVDVYQQFDNYFRFQEHYTDHNSSNTIVLDPSEWMVASGIVHTNWSDFVGVSFLAKDGGSYQLAPYEQNPERYDQLVAEMSDFDMNILQKFDHGQEVELEGTDCESGACPIR
jgi:hypothetical protein